MSKKKYLLTIIVVLQICAILFVVSYAWFYNDANDKNVVGDDIQISSTEDLIMKYRGVTYSSLKLNDIVSTHFKFEQVSSTGLGDPFYKIDYAPRLSNKPAKYIEATANQDYIEMELTLTASSKAKRVYLDAQNSGFVIGEPAGDPLKNDDSAIKCMRLSLSYTDNSNNQRNVVLANDSYKNYVCLSSDLVQKDEKGNPQYSFGVAQYVTYAETDFGHSAIEVTGTENVQSFADYDLASNNDGNILFDLAANQSKRITVRIWLDGTAAELQEGVDKVCGRPITCSLQFSSTTNLGTETSSKIVSSGMTIDTAAQYASKANNLTKSNMNINKFEIPYSSNHYLLKTDTYVLNGNTLTYNYGSVVDRIYTKTTIDGSVYYHDNSNQDILYYDLDNQIAYVKYGDLQWKLANNLTQSMPNKITGAQTSVSLGTFNSTTKIVTIGNGTIGDTFNLIGYVTLDGDQVNVVNETYIFGNIVTLEEFVPIGISSNNGIYTSTFISDLYATDNGFNVNINGNYELIKYDDYDHFVWRVGTYSSIDSTKTPLTTMYNCIDYVDGKYYLTTNGTTHLYNDLVINTDNVMVNDTFYLLGCYVDDYGHEEVVIRVLFFVSN